MSLFELSLLGGAAGKRLARRGEALGAIDWGRAAEGASQEALAAGRCVWTQSAFSEYCSAAAFAEITRALLAAGAPVDLIAAAADFSVDEIFHAELSARAAMALGGAAPLEVDLTRLVRPAGPGRPLAQAAELLVRTCCVGEQLTVAALGAARKQAREPFHQILSAILRDEVAHAELGLLFLDWAVDDLSGDERAALGQVAGATVRSFSPLFGGECAQGAALGVAPCDSYDQAFCEALERRVVAPLRERGVVVPEADVRAAMRAARGGEPPREAPGHGAG